MVVGMVWVDTIVVGTRTEMACVAYDSKDQVSMDSKPRRSKVNLRGFSPSLFVSRY